LIRYHIVLVAMAATLVFGWLFSGRYLLGLSLWVGLDWFLINLLNRVTDIDEDLRNGIEGTQRAERWRTPLLLLVFGTMAASFGSHWVYPEITVLRAVVQLIGVCYSYRLVPCPAALAPSLRHGLRGSRLFGLRRLKEIYFVKNSGSALLFLLTCIAYPIRVAGLTAMPPSAPYYLAAFFGLYELTYEIIYDLRDLEGDRAEHIPTYPVVHGERASRHIIAALLTGSVVALVMGVARGALGVRELLFAAAPLHQWVFVSRRPKISVRDCIVITHRGTALLVFFTFGTAAWLQMGGPSNIMLTATQACSPDSAIDLRPATGGPSSRGKGAALRRASGRSPALRLRRS
jgi:hypothetical protein